MRTRTKTLLAAGLAIAVLAVVAAVGMVRRGFSTHAEPTALEAFVARTVRHWSVPADLRSASNPLAAAPEVLAEARAHWADHCAICHGNDGKGRTMIGERLYPRAPDMTVAETQGLSDGELFAVIENGIRLTGMPGWGDGSAESGYGSWSLVHLIRLLPELTAAEVAEMEALTPKTVEEWERLRGETPSAGAEAVPPPEHDHASTPHHH